MERCTLPTEKPKPLMRDEDGRVIAVECRECGRLALNVEVGLCCRCGFGQILAHAAPTNAVAGKDR